MEVNMWFGVKTYWRYKGEKAWKTAWPVREEHRLIRMAPYNGAAQGGPIVSPSEIEYKQ
jgi:hypothetical protein